MTLLPVKKIKKQAFSIDDIPAEVAFKSIKNMYLRVVPPLGEIRISAPRGTSMQTIRQFALLRKGWILRKRLNLAENTPPSSFRCTDGERCTLCGKEYFLRIEELSEKSGVELDGSCLTLLAPPGALETQKMKILESWRKEQLLKRVESLLSRWEPRMGVKVASISLRRMKTRWGSCTPSAGKIRLNTALAATPEEILEYVLIHEMAHILEPNHGTLFWSIVEEHLPDWKSSRKCLKKYSPEKAR